MPKSCSAYNCTNRYNNKNPEITFHSGLGNRKNLLWNAVPTLFAVPARDTKQNNCRKRLKRALKAAADKWDDTAPDRTPLFTEETQTEEMHEDAQHSHGTEEAYCQTTKDLAATDHTYALWDPCTTKARLFNVLDANSWLQKRLQTKCRLIKRMKLKLLDAQRELLTLRRQLRYRHTYRQRNSQLLV
ncbi:THAP domain-containing protein 3-like isoform X2 [Puntigrus tetrazona]|uniref:THAP domain-containing protein 3 isoform X2 n=1 Tax=Puntigrus tetrazona TaxID=1606681 RepID=UPI001C8AFEB1|nr:THAP domain-containing protein 3 isoform X2 [Puntigrus tetrazona]XP_043081357.1 THAP domain-containing protein 3-like isoform X2 [Puntigrus tetrazona]